MDYEREIKELLKDHGGKLDRINKHQVYKFPNGEIMLLSHNPQQFQLRLAYLHTCKKLGLEPKTHGAGKPSGKKKERFRARFRFDYIEPRGKTFGEKLLEAISGR